ncbi:MAG: O-antigen ligase family protein, partial [Candidatus Eremiobacteraeota bacterium]|nr:O-antigen ligase family protein [Candidatus Eremiobacteraeota bacterium]
MVGFLRTHRPANLFVISLIAALGTIAAYASVALSGTKTGVVLAGIAIFGPALLYGALSSPIAFPFALYIFLIPFNNLLMLDAFGTVTRLVAIASGAAMLFFMLRTRKVATPPDVLVIWVLYYLWIATTTFWALNLESSMLLIPTMVQLLLIYAVVAIFPMDLQRLRIVVGAAVAGGFAASAYGVMVFRSGAANGYQGRLYLSTDNAAFDPNHFASGLILPVALALVGALWTRRPLVRVAYAVAVAVMLLAMAYSASRGALLGVFAVILFLLIRDRHRIQLAGVSAVIGGLVLALQTTLIQRFSQALSTGGAGRIDIWRVALSAFKKYWLTGAGFGNFPDAYDKVLIQSYQLNFTGEHRAPHNLLLGTSVELGIVGLALLLIAWYGHIRLLNQ